MGNKICFHPRVILTQEIALHFRSSNLVRDVQPIIKRWRADGAELCFNIHEFGQTFDIVVDTERQFATFDTDRNGKVDAHEVLMVYVLLSTGQVDDKIDTVFNIFDFSGSRELAGTINFDEAIMMLEACVKGIQKVCETDFAVTDEEVFFHCNSLFDMHHVKHNGRITKKHFTEWTNADPSPRAFLQLFHNSAGLPDIFASVNKVNLSLGRVFQMLARGQLFVEPEALKASNEFRQALGEPYDDEIEDLVEMMLDGEPRVSNDRYHAVLRPWNIFNECDLDQSYTLDEKELEVLLWIQLRQKPSADFVQQFTKALFVDDDTEIPRIEWVQSMMNSMAGKPLKARKRVSHRRSKSTVAPAVSGERRHTRKSRVAEQLRLSRPGLKFDPRLAHLTDQVDEGAADAAAVQGGQHMVPVR
mmetsp:Transcript_7405/g.16925  ORF Transcript_7405/g.16925 Transcript_7405/m.16925 type:complete len:416 (+) Transcript_7405:59-1306(+)